MRPRNWCSCEMPNRSASHHVEARERSLGEFGVDVLDRGALPRVGGDARDDDVGLSALGHLLGDADPGALHPGGPDHPVDDRRGHLGAAPGKVA